MLKSLALFLSGIILFIMLVYCGLTVAEKGLLELTAFQNPAGALHCKREDHKIIIIFAGEKYNLSLISFN